MKTSYCRMPISIVCDWWLRTVIRQWLFLPLALVYMVTRVLLRLK